MNTRLFSRNFLLQVAKNKRNTLNSTEILRKLFQRNFDIYSRAKTVSEITSETGRIVSNASMCMMLKIVNTPNMSGETRETIWMSRQSVEILNGLMSASIQASILPIIAFVSRTGLAAITSTASHVSIRTIISDAYPSKNMIIVSLIHLIRSLNMKGWFEKS